MYNETQLNSTICLRKPECGACTSQNQNSNIAVSYEKRYKKDLEKPQWAHENIFTGCCGLCVAFGIPKPTDKNPWALLWKMLAYETSFAHFKKNGITQNFQMSLRRPWRYWWSILRYGQDSPPFARKNSLLIQCPPVCLFCLFVHVTCSTALECNCYYFIAFVILLLSHETSENDGRFEIVSIRWPSFKWSELKNWCTLMHSLKRFPGTTMCMYMNKYVDLIDVAFMLFAVSVCWELVGKFSVFFCMNQQLLTVFRILNEAIHSSWRQHAMCWKVNFINNGNANGVDTSTWINYVLKRKQ